MPDKSFDPIPTRHSLLNRLKDWRDQTSWQEFFDAYWQLIFNVAVKAGLSDVEAQEVVQETVITVAKNITKYEREAGSFRGWLLHITRWRIADQFRKRAPATAHHQRTRGGGTSRGTATIERVPDPASVNVEDCWEEQWQKHVLSTAIERVKNRVSPRQYQMFELYVLREWPVGKVAKTLGTSAGQVYLAKHRISALLKRERKLLETQM